eukprot:3376703-Prymnesium_polylepis.1
MHIGKTSEEPHSQIPYCGFMPYVHPQLTQDLHTAASHTALHDISQKRRFSLNGAAHVKAAQQSSNGARTGAKCHLMMPQPTGERAGIFPRCHSWPGAPASHR